LGQKRGQTEIIKKDMKNGLITLKISNMDDLWHLDHIIEEGDLLKAKTTRRTTVKRGDSVEKGDKKVMSLTIEAEKKSFENKELSEDEKINREKRLQELTDEFIDKIDKIGEAKKQDLMQV